SPDADRVALDAGASDAHGCRGGSGRVRCLAGMLPSGHGCRNSAMTPSSGDPSAAATSRGVEQELRELRAVNELIRTLTSTLELSEILRRVLDRLKSLTQAEALSLMLYDPERDELVFAATETLRENAVVGLRLPPSRSLASWVARTGESALVNDVQGDPRFYPEIDRVTRFTTRNLLSVPLFRRGRVVGVLEVANRHGGGTFEDVDRARLESLAREVEEDCDPETLCGDAETMRALLT